MTKKSLAALAALAASLSAAPAGAQDVYKIGISAGLTGYAATVDRAWRDGVEVAVAALNRQGPARSRLARWRRDHRGLPQLQGGIMGRKLEVVTEDNSSEPQEAVTVYRKMISSDKVEHLPERLRLGRKLRRGADGGARADPDGAVLDPAAAARSCEMGVHHHCRRPRFEVEKRLEYLKEKTQIKKIGVLHDPTPYANVAEGRGREERRQTTA